MLDWTLRAVRKDKAQSVPASRPMEQKGGLVAGTLVATSRGWLPVEQIAAGDEVMTFDDGVQEVTGITRRLHPMPCGDAGKGADLCPLLSVAAGLIGNRRPMLLPDGQAMLVESDFAEACFGDPFAAMDSTELLGLPGVRKMLPEDSVVVVTLAFEEDQMVFVEGHALAYCPAARLRAPMSIEEAIWAEDARRYQLLSHADAELVVAGMVATDEKAELPSPLSADTYIA